MAYLKSLAIKRAEIVIERRGARPAALEANQREPR